MASAPRGVPLTRDNHCPGAEKQRATSGEKCECSEAFRDANLSTAEGRRTIERSRAGEALIRSYFPVRSSVAGAIPWATVMLSPEVSELMNFGANAVFGAATIPAISADSTFVFTVTPTL